MASPHPVDPLPGPRHLIVAADPEGPVEVDVDRVTEDAAIATLITTTSPDVRAGMLAILADDDPADPLHRVILAAVREMVNQEAPVDPVTLLTHLRGHHLLAAGSFRLGSDVASRVFRLIEAAQFTTGLAGPHYARALVDIAVRRQVVGEAERIVGLAKGAAPAEFVAAVSDAVDALLARLSRSATS